jgi:hypothetical protein
MEPNVITNKDNISRAHSGKTSCMCGCQGKVSSDNTEAFAIYDTVMNHPAVVFNEFDKSARIGDSTASRSLRNLVVYFKD